MIFAPVHVYSRFDANELALRIRAGMPFWQVIYLYWGEKLAEGRCSASLIFTGPLILLDSKSFSFRNVIFHTTDWRLLFAAFSFRACMNSVLRAMPPANFSPSLHAQFR